MDAKEIEIFEALKEEYSTGAVSKKNAKMSQEVYNKYNDDKIESCMCSTVKRRILSKQMLDWFDSYL